MAGLNVPAMSPFFVSMKGLVSIFLTVTALLAVSCVHSEEDTNAPGDCISFSVAAETLAGAGNTKAAYQSGPVVLTSDTADTLWLHASVEDYVSPSPETRAVPGTTDNFASAHGSFRVDAYNSSDALYMSDVKVDSYSGGHWRPSDGDRFWPGKESLSFYAIAPYGLSGLSELKLDETEGKVSFSYETLRGGSDDAERQPDLMLAYSLCSQDDAAAGAVPMNFSHALSAIQFKAKDMAGCTVKSITIDGVAGSGDCVAEPAVDGGYSWTVGSAAYSYTQAFDVPVADGGEQGITASAPEKTFMMIPQTTPADARVVIVIETSKGETLTVNGSIAGQVWEPGKLYTYAISTDSINWSYVFDVTPQITLENGHVIGTYSVKSYRYRTYNESVKEPLAWTAELKDQESKDNGDIISFTYSGIGSVSASGESHSLKCRPLDLLTSNWPGDMEVLRKSAPRGTESVPWDLSLDDGYTGSATTANCYLVHASGHYRLPLVYGNALKKGSANTSAYKFSASTSTIYLQSFPRVGGNITQPYIYNDSKVADCKLLWQDAINVVTDVRLSSDKKYLEFDVNAKNLVQGNAMVAVRDASGNVLWSWHIWVTEYDPTASGNLNPNDGTLMVAPVDDYDTPSTKYHLLTKQIGWCDGKILTYQARQTKVVFKQVKGLTVEKELLIDQRQYDFESTVNNGAYYQWGRKDPFIGIISRDKESVKLYYDEDNDPINSLKWKSGQVSVADGIKNPDMLYLGNQHWMKTPYKQNLWNNRVYNKSGNPIKTVYDPSPKGFMVADRKVYRVFSKTGATYHVDGSSATLANFKSNLNGEYDYAGDNKYTYVMYTGKNKTGSKIEFPATGERYYTSNTKLELTPGQILNPTYVYCWIADDMNGKAQATAMTLALGYKSGEAAIWVDETNSGACSMARPVYCVRER